MTSVPTIEHLRINQIERGQISRFWLELSTGGLGHPLRVPLLVARGWEDGPVLGVTAVVHGNALNGLPIAGERETISISGEDWRKDSQTVPAQYLTSGVHREDHKTESVAYAVCHGLLVVGHSIPVACRSSRISRRGLGQESAGAGRHGFAPVAYVQRSGRWTWLRRSSRLPGLYVG